MTDRPILFSAPMVRALLAGRKTQTRRVAVETTLPHLQHADDIHVTTGAGLLTRTYRFRRKFAVGDRLWVRETWNVPDAYLEPARRQCALGIMNYAATPWGTPGAWRPSIFMPRWASRLTLTVTDIRVERLQEISEADAIAEGAEVCRLPGIDGGIMVHTDNPGVTVSPGRWYRQLWDGLNAERGYGWDANPWVVAVTFTVEPRNIDQVRQ